MDAEQKSEIDNLYKNVLSSLYYILREMVSMPLAMIFIAQVLLGILVGGLGLVLATPILAVVVLVKMLYVEDVLGDHTNK